MNPDKLVKQFTDLGLVLKIAKKPFARGIDADKVFGLDVITNDGPEHFLCWPGHEETIVHIAATDKSTQQLVLTIKEAEVEFETLVQPFAYRNYLKFGDKWLTKWISETGPRVPRKGRNGSRPATFDDFVFAKGELWMKTRTEAIVRHFLVGMDEMHLFMTQLPRPATSMEAAYDSLKNRLITIAGAKDLALDRQGEWFFIEPTKEQRQRIDGHLKKGALGVVHKKVAIGPHAGRSGGKPHTVDELIKLMPPVDTRIPPARRDPRARDDVFVRGAVRHADHKTIKFLDWRRVLLNNENPTVGLGGTWID